MKSLYSIKNIDNSVLDVDTTGRRVKNVLNRVNYKDFDGDVIASNAFDVTISDRGPKNKNLIWHLTDHNASLKTAVAKFSEIYMEGDNLIGVTNVPNTAWGNDVLELYKTGNINQHSIGFKSIKQDKQKDNTYGEYNLIKEVMLYEGSAVLWGANDQTPNVTVGKSLTKEEIDSEYKKTMDDLNTLYKMFKTGHLSDQSYELIEIKIKQLTNKLQQLFDEASQPALKAVDPESNGVLNVLTTFNNKFNGQENERTRVKGAA